MRAGRLARIPACALLAALSIAGCGGGGGEGRAPTLTVYVSVPLHGPSAPHGKAIRKGAKLALSDAGGRAGDLELKATYLDDTSGEGARARWDPVATAENARRAAQDSSAIAYIGDFESGATRTSLPITNEAMMLHVSPASTATDLVRDAPGSNDVPHLYQPSGERTFGRVIPDDDRQAEAGAVWARKLGLERVATLSDGSRFGELMVSEFAEEGSALGFSVVGERRVDLGAPRSETRGTLNEIGRERPAGIYYGGTIPPRSRPAGETAGGLPLLSFLLRAAGEGIRAIGSDALLGPGLLGALRSASLRFPPGPLLVTSAAQDPSELPPEGQRFVRDYRERFGIEPDPYAAYGYEAMAVVLDSIERAENGEDRAAMIDAFFSTADRSSVLGTYSIDSVGNTTLDRLAGYRVRDGRPAFETALRAP